MKTHTFEWKIEENWGK